MRYDNVDSTIKDPMNALNAVDEPRYMQPSTVHTAAQRTMELNGFRCLWLTRPKNPLNGVALSRASVQNTRLAVR